MYNTLKHNLLHNWNVIRWIRLAISIILIIQAVQMHDMLLGFLGFFFMLQSLANTGCCTTHGCKTNINVSGNSKIVEFEEVKNA